MFLLNNPSYQPSRYTLESTRFHRTPTYVDANIVEWCRVAQLLASGDALKWHQGYVLMNVSHNTIKNP